MVASWDPTMLLSLISAVTLSCSRKTVRKCFALRRKLKSEHLHHTVDNVRVIR
jgi:hypothetical protein